MWGIKIERSDYCEIMNNLCDKNYLGIYCETVESIISNNNCSNNYFGLMLAGVQNSEIHNNELSHNHIGLDIGYCDESFFFDNVINHNSEIGIYFQSTQEATLQHNFLENNTVSVELNDYYYDEERDYQYNYRESSNNHWNENYWSDFKTEYPHAMVNFDGITWSVPYQIGNEFDFNPLVTNSTSAFDSDQDGVYHSH